MLKSAGCPWCGMRSDNPVCGRVYGGNPAGHGYRTDADGYRRQDSSVSTWMPVPAPTSADVPRPFDRPAPTPEEARCAAWKHGPRKVLWCENPNCPGMTPQPDLLRLIRTIDRMLSPYGFL